MPRAGERPASHGPRKELLDDAELFARVSAPEMLQRAWSKVWSNGGAAGGDYVTVEAFARNVVARLSRLRRALRDGSYRPGPVREVHVPKRSGSGLRKLAIPCVVDRVAQTAAAMVLTPLLDEEFEPSSFGYRPGRSVKQAVARVMAARSEGFNWVVDADIENYFDSIPHDGLMERWAQSVSHGPLTELVWLWLTSAEPSGRGVAQGSPLSPLLSNLYLDRLDEALFAHDMRLVRFADDFVILCRSEHGAERAMKRAARLLAGHGLKLNMEKSRIIDFERGFRFLGHLFVRSMALKTTPEKADENDIRELMRELARKEAREAAAEADRQAREASMRARGYSPGFRVLHIMSADRRLNIRNQSFTVEEARGGPGEGLRWRELIAIPHREVDRIDIGPSAGFTEEALRHALATDTAVAFVGGHGETLGWACEPLAERAGRHLAQAKVALDEGERLRLARILVEGRLRNQRAMLRRILAERKKSGRARPARAVQAIATISHLLGRGDTSRIRHARDMEMLLGYEGQAAAQWWRAIGALAHGDFSFAIRRGDNPPNIVLDFLSWLLHRDISVAVMRAGLHPGFGALHAVSDRRDAAVYDLMEEFRAQFIGGLFVHITNKRIIRREMFDHEPGRPRRMKPQAVRAIIRAYEQRAEGRVKSPRGKVVSWRLLMQEQAFGMAAHVEGRRDYRPYEMTY